MKPKLLMIACIAISLVAGVFVGAQGLSILVLDPVQERRVDARIDSYLIAVRFMSEAMINETDVDRLRGAVSGYAAISGYGLDAVSRPNEEAGNSHFRFLGQRDEYLRLGAHAEHPTFLDRRIADRIVLATSTSTAKNEGSE